MKNNFTMLFIAFIISGNIILAQKNSNGLSTNSTNTVHGTIQVNLPSTIRSGDVISGTVRVKPKGKNQKQKDKALKQLQDYSVVIDQNTWDTGKTPQQWTAASNNTIAKVLDPKNNVVATFPITVLPASNAINNTYVTPTFLRSGYANAITGNFDGNAANTSVLLNQEPIDILAESPQEVVYDLPSGISGEHQLTINENGNTSTETYNVVDLEIYADKYDLARGEITTLHIKVFGLQNLDTQVAYQLDNLSPTNVDLEGGPNQTVIINQDEINADGTYSKDYQLRAIRAGGFSISCTLLPPQDNQNNETEDESVNNPQPNPEPPSLTSTSPFYNPLPIIMNAEYEMNPSGTAQLINYTYDNNTDIQFYVHIPEADIKRERNKARDIPQSTPLEPRDPDARDKPYSRPVPTGLKTPKYDGGNPWDDADELLDKAKSEVKRAEDHEGEIKSGIPGFTSVGLTKPAKTITTSTADGVNCTEYVYYFSQRYSYINDRTLLHEEQLSPSYEFFVAEGQSKIDVTETETGWEVAAKASASKGPVEVEVSGKYWEKTTKIKGKGSSSLKGRHLWLFHVGRLFLVRKAFLRIKYEYHYEVCDDGTSRNWVNVTYSDNWMYWYEWQEELFVASKDDEGNFHRVDAFPYTSHTTQQGGETESYEAEDLERRHFRNPHSEGFFPNR